MRFSVNDHTRSWQHYDVRPHADAARPELTDDRYCVYDEPHGDYLYTDAWVKKLVRALADDHTFELVVGHKPSALP